jgi:hypothetical protein
VASDHCHIQAPDAAALAQTALESFLKTAALPVNKVRDRDVQLACHYAAPEI